LKKNAAAAAAVAASLALTTPLAHAETRIIVPGTEYAINGSSVQLAIKLGTPFNQTLVGSNWLPGTTPQLVSYPASIVYPDLDASIGQGQVALNHEITTAIANGDPVYVTGLSQGSIVVDHELTYLASDPKAPSPSQLSFVIFSDPGYGTGLLSTYLPDGATVAGYTQVTPPQSRYNVTYVYAQWDGFSNAPDRPWDLVADANAILGIKYEHTPASEAVPSDAVVQWSTTNTLGGTTTVEMIPEPTLPLVQPLVTAGVPASITNPLNKALTPIVEEGYSRYTPKAGPYVSGGKIVGLNVRAPSRSFKAPTQAVKNTVRHADIRSQQHGSRREPRAAGVAALSRRTAVASSGNRINGPRHTA
jgi:hypothetical protein